MQRVAQAAFQHHPLHRLLIHFLREKSEAFFALFRGVHRHIRFFDQLFDFRAVIGIQADADAGGHIDFMPLNDARRGNFLADFPRDFRNIGHVMQRVQNNREFIAAQPENVVAFADALLKPGGNLAQQKIAQIMA